MTTRTRRSDAPRIAPPGSAQPTRFVDDYLLYLLAAASHAASADFHRAVRRHGLRVPDWRVLACACDADGLMITELAELTLFEQSRLTKVVDQLEAKRWIERRGDATDKRRVRVFITPAGRAKVVPLMQAARAHEQVILAGLPPATRETLKAGLRQLIGTR